MADVNLQLILGMGRPVFPCKSSDKSPLTVNGFKGASLDLNQILKWHEQHPGCAWGMPTCAAWAVVDVDPRHGGDASWDALIAQHGPIPKTPTVKTGGGGWHFYLAFPPGTRSGKLAGGIDLKAEGGYVIVPPSKVLIPEHEGRGYKWSVPPWEVDIAPAPAWLAGLATAEPKGVPGRAGDGDIRTHLGSPEGQRRVTLCRLAGTALGQGHEPAAVWGWAEAWADRCTPPFGEWEKHVAGLVRREAGKPNNTLTTPSSSPAPGATADRGLVPRRRVTN